MSARGHEVACCPPGKPGVDGPPPHRTAPRQGDVLISNPSPLTGERELYTVVSADIYNAAGGPTVLVAEIETGTRYRATSYAGAWRYVRFGRTLGRMDHWLSIEIFDGEFPASSWRRAHGDNLTEAAITNGALRWEWHEHRWGVVLELKFTDDEERDRFRELPAVRAALDAVPDPLTGLLVYPGRGGGSGARAPRRPRPLPMSGAGARPEPYEEQFVRLRSLLRWPHRQTLS